MYTDLISLCFVLFIIPKASNQFVALFSQLLKRQIFHSRSELLWADHHMAILPKGVTLPGNAASHYTLSDLIDKSLSCDVAFACFFASLWAICSEDFNLHKGQEQWIFPLDNRPGSPPVQEKANSSPPMRLSTPSFRLIVRRLCQRIFARFPCMYTTPQQFPQPVGSC